MTPKQLIQRAWVIEVAVVIVVSIAVAILAPADRIEAWVRMMPLLTALIGGQGIIAAAGPEIKRFTESRRNIPEVGG